MTHIKNTAIVIVTTCLALLLLEGALRLALSPSQLYSSHHTVPRLNQWRHEVRFWETYRNREEGAFSNYDSSLGWDIDRTGDRVRGSRLHLPTTDQLRIVALGDSFTFGLDVDESQNFAAELAARYPSIDVLNMGVPGYGIDQAYLKYREIGQRFMPDVVIFGVYVGDYERSSMGFTSFAKPQFVVTSDGIVVAGQPVAPVAQELRRISQSLANRVYLVELARNAMYKLTTRDVDRAKFFDVTDSIVHHIFDTLVNALDSKQSLIVVHIPRAEAFVEHDALHDEMSRRLLAIYAALGITAIDLTTRFVENLSQEQAFLQYYVHEPDGSVGHLSHQGRLSVTRAIPLCFSYLT